MNTAVREHLRRITDAERAKTLRWALWLRAIFIALSTVQGVWNVRIGRAPEAAPTIPIMVAWLCVAWLSAIVGERVRGTLKYAGLSIGLIDIPLATVAAYVAIPLYTEKPYLLSSLLPALSALVVTTVLALDYRAIALATVSAVASTAFIVLSIGAPSIEIEDPVFAMVCTGVICAFIVSRLRALVTESRRKDFAGKYVLGERIGVGGMAEVFTATYSPEGGFERRVAVKRVLPAYANDAEFMQLFRREAQVGAQLAHPNLVQVLDFGRHFDSWFIAMELVEGVSLAEVTRAWAVRGPLSPAACLFVISEVAEGLAYLHEKRSGDGAHVGLVHRDLNPPNVLISTSGEVKISDFGIARWADSGSLTRAGAIRGKLPYMAPEVIGGAPASAASDLFALGVLAHELLSGQRLFVGATDTETSLAVREKPIPALASLRPDVPAKVDAVIAALLERDPARRTASARDVSSALRAIEGPAAPYPTGRDALVKAIEGLKVRAAMMPPTPSPTDDTKTSAG